MENSKTKLLSHFDANGQAHMVDVSEKKNTARVAVAVGVIHLSEDTLAIIKQGDAHKGDVLGVARIAGIQAAKRTSELIPLCHSIMLSYVAVDFKLLEQPCRIECQAQAETMGPTGVEMEALMAVQVALLTIYDMCKAVQRDMHIGDVRLLSKTGGRSTYRA